MKNNPLEQVKKAIVEMVRNATEYGGSAEVERAYSDFRQTLQSIDVPLDYDDADVLEMGRAILESINKLK